MNAVLDTGELQDYLAIAAEMLDAKGTHDASSLLRRAEHPVEETGYDNWNGGTRIDVPKYRRTRCRLPCF